jgi:hypothetical protein
VISRSGWNREFSSQSSLITYFWSDVLTPLILTPYTKTGKVVFLISAVNAIARNHPLLFSSSILAFSIRVKNRRSPLRSFLTTMIYLVISRGSRAFIIESSLRISFFFVSSFSSRSLIVTFSSLRFYSAYYEDLRSVTLRIWAGDTTIWLHVRPVGFGGVFSWALISSVFLRICARGLAVTVGSDAFFNASIIYF